MTFLKSFAQYQLPWSLLFLSSVSSSCHSALHVAFIFDGVLEISIRFGEDLKEMEWNNHKGMERNGMRWNEIYLSKENEWNGTLSGCFKIHE